MKHRIGKVKNKVVVEGGGTNTLRNNEVLVEGNAIKIKENGQVSNISGSSGGGGDRGNYIYCIVKDLNTIFNYNDLLSILKSYLIHSNNFYICYQNISGGFPEGTEIILHYEKLELPLKCYYNGEFRNIITLEEFEQLTGLDSNNRPFKIITEEEFYKDLTEEEARKIASEL